MGGEGSANYEPKLDYTVVKMPRWPLTNLLMQTAFSYTDEGNR